MTSVNHDDRRCANCGKITTLSCPACAGAPSATERKSCFTWYCGTNCQEAHWAVHETDCKAARDRQVLGFAGIAMQQIVYVFLRQSFMWNPGRIEKIGMDWLVHHRTYTGESRLVPFPYDLFPDTHEQQALLTYSTCMVACSCMLETIRSLFRGRISRRPFDKGRKSDRTDTT